MEGATIVVNSRREPNVTKAVNELKAAGVENVVGIKEMAKKGYRTFLSRWFKNMIVTTLF